jgi:hypothetical protein
VPDAQDPAPILVTGLDLFDLLMATRLIAPARRASERERLAALPRLERASVTLAGAVTALLDVLAAADAGAVGVADAWRAVEKVAPRDRVREAAVVVGELVPDDSAGEAAMRAALAGRYRVVRPFLVLLSEALPLDAAPAGQKILAALRTLPDLAARRVRQRPLSRNEIDADLVPPVWGRAVYGNRDLPHGFRISTARALPLIPARLFPGPQINGYGRLFAHRI